VVSKIRTDTTLTLRMFFSRRMVYVAGFWLWSLGFYTSWVYVKTGDEVDAKLGFRGRDGVHQTQTQEPKFVLLFAYMRGGSSFFGSTFIPHPEVYYFYEPYWDIYNAFTASQLYTYPIHVVFNDDGSIRDMPDYERNFVRENIIKTLTCDFRRMPAESLLNEWTLDKDEIGAYTDCLRANNALSLGEHRCQRSFRTTCSGHINLALQTGCHTFLERAHTGDNSTEGLHADFPPVQDYRTCIQKLQTKVTKCLPERLTPCLTSRIRATKMLRTRMKYMEDIIQALPNVKIIHQLRDPRGTVTSRQSAGRLARKPLVEESKLLCAKMVSDIKERHQLELKYPGVFLQTKYESMADDPMGSLEQLYKHIGEPIPEIVRKTVKDSTSASKSAKITAFSTNRKNSSATAHAWTSKLKADEREQIDYICKDALNLAGYDIV